MAYPREQIDELRGYCKKISALSEGGIDFLHLEDLRLPAGCSPASCDALFCPTAKDGYPSRLYFSVQVSGQFARNWNGTARIGEKNWYAFSWKVDFATPPSLAQILLAQLNGFAMEK
jgi:hypothetical protein